MIVNGDKLKKFQVGGNATYLRSFNDRNDGVGVYVQVANGETSLQSFINYRGAIQRFSVEGAESTSAYGINDKSDIAGSYTDSDGRHHGFVMANGATQTIDFKKTGNTFVVGIDNSGNVAGNYRHAGQTEAFVQRNGRFRAIDFPGADQIYITALSGNGRVLGYYSNASGEHAFMYYGGRYEAINYPDTGDKAVLNGINDAGKVVGHFRDDDSHLTAIIGQSASALAQNDLHRTQLVTALFDAALEPSSIADHPDSVRMNSAEHTSLVSAEPSIKVFHHSSMLRARRQRAGATFAGQSCTNWFASGGTAQVAAPIVHFASVSSMRSLSEPAAITAARRQTVL